MKRSIMECLLLNIGTKNKGCIFEIRLFMGKKESQYVLKSDHGNMHGYYVDE